MYYLFTYSLFIVTLSLGACSDNVPTIIPVNVNNASPEISNHATKLRLDIPNLSEKRTTTQEIQMILGEGIELLATLEDQNGNSLPNQNLYISSQRGNFFTENNLLTNHNGQATSLLLATVVGEDVITVMTPTGLTVQLMVMINDDEGEGDITIEELPKQTVTQLQLNHNSL